MHVEIITPDKKVFDGEAISAQFPGIGGSFEILQNHAPLISALDRGQVKITTSAGAQLFNIDGGVVEVLKNQVIVLAESIID